MASPEQHIRNDRELLEEEIVQGYAMKKLAEERGEDYSEIEQKLNENLDEYKDVLAATLGNIALGGANVESRVS